MEFELPGNAFYDDEDGLLMHSRLSLTLTTLDGHSLPARGSWLVLESDAGTPTPFATHSETPTESARGTATGRESATGTAAGSESADASSMSGQGGPKWSLSKPNRWRLIALARDHSLAGTLAAFKYVSPPSLPLPLPRLVHLLKQPFYSSYAYLLESCLHFYSSSDAT